MGSGVGRGEEFGVFGVTEPCSAVHLPARVMLGLLLGWLAGWVSDKGG